MGGLTADRAGDRQGHLDRRFSDPAATPLEWRRATDALEAAELYWLSTVRPDGRPHVTPLIGVLLDDRFHLVTGEEEQKARNLARHPAVAVTTGCNAWARGLDLVLEGVAERVTGADRLERVADALERKYGAAWHFDVEGDVLVSEAAPALVYGVRPTKLIAFAKDPHGQTTFRL